MNLPVIALLLAEQAQGNELIVPAPWFGIVMFAVLMLSLLVTIGFANKGRELPADTNTDH